MKRELITFQVESERFGVDVTVVREIRAWTSGARLPFVPDYVTGAVNLRGTIIPVIDLAVRLGWNPTNATDRHAIIVIELGDKLCGLIVDEVSDIVNIDSDTLQPAPVISSDNTGSLLEGLTTIDDGLVIVLDTTSLREDLSLVEDMRMPSEAAA